MSASVAVTIWCDGWHLVLSRCTEAVETGERLTGAARELAGTWGWRCNRNGDLCPKCVARQDGAS